MLTKTLDLLLCLLHDGVFIEYTTHFTYLYFSHLSEEDLKDSMGQDTIQGDEN